MAVRRSNILWILGAILVGIAAAGVSVYVGMADQGVIDVNQQIKETDQATFEKKVNTNTQATVPNGGLRPKGKSTTQQQPAAAPEPVETSEESGDEGIEEGAEEDGAAEESLEEAANEDSAELEDGGSSGESEGEAPPEDQQ